MSHDITEAILRALDFDPDPVVEQCETIHFPAGEQCPLTALYLVRHRCPYCTAREASAVCQDHRDKIASYAPGTALICKSCGRRSSVSCLSIVPLDGGDS